MRKSCKYYHYVSKKILQRGRQLPLCNTRAVIIDLKVASENVYYIASYVTCFALQVYIRISGHQVHMGYLVVHQMVWRD